MSADIRYKKPYEYSESDDYTWLISADKIFSGPITAFENFAEIYDLEFVVKEYSIVDGPKFADSLIQACDVIIEMPFGTHCPILQSRLAGRTVIKKLLINRVIKANKQPVPCEELVFEQVTIQSFMLNGKKVKFSFRYNSYSYSCTDLKIDGTKRGTTAVSINAKWETKES